MRQAATFTVGRHNESAGVLSSLFASAARFYRSWKSRRRLVKMTDLDDQILNDIGVSRSDIHAVLDLPFSQNAAYELQLIAQRNRASWRLR